MKKNNKKGFTLVELVIVIAVIAILAAVLIPTFSSVINNAKVSAARSEAHNLQIAIMAEAGANFDEFCSENSEKTESTLKIGEEEDVSTYVSGKISDFKVNAAENGKSSITYTVDSKIKVMIRADGVYVGEKEINKANGTEAPAETPAAE